MALLFAGLRTFLTGIGDFLTGIGPDARPAATESKRDKLRAIADDTGFILRRRLSPEEVNIVVSGTLSSNMGPEILQQKLDTLVATERDLSAWSENARKRGIGFAKTRTPAELVKLDMEFWSWYIHWARGTLDPSQPLVDPNPVYNADHAFVEITTTTVTIQRIFEI
jgi:hypothetical protein